MNTHHHFGLTTDGLAALRTAFPAAKTAQVVSCLYDTRDLALAKANRWLIYQQGRWTLKVSTPTDENLIIFSKERDNVIPHIGQALGISVAPQTTDMSRFDDVVLTLAQMGVERYAILRTTRCTFMMDDGWSLYVDSVRFASDDHYLVGTLSVEGEGKAMALEWPDHLSFLKPITPVRSRIMEFLSSYHKDLYRKLREAKVVPQADFHGGDLLHHSTCLLQSPRPTIERLPEPEPDQPVKEEGKIGWTYDEVAQWNVSVE